MSQRTSVRRLAGAVLLSAGGWLAGAGANPVASSPAPSASVALPSPALDGPMSLERALQRRRSQRAFSDAAFGLAEVGQLLWAAQGITGADGMRSAPSAGGLHPIEVWLVTGEMVDLAAGIYRYAPMRHALELARAGEWRARIAAATRGQGWVADAPLQLVITGNPARTASRYGQRAPRYLQIEAGTVAQNVYLQSTARGWATVLVGAFDEAALGAVLGLPKGHVVLGLMPVGWPR